MKIDKIRTWFQGIATLFINSGVGFINKGSDFLNQVSVYQGRDKGFCMPVLNCHSCPTARFTCPIGAIQYTLANHDQNVIKTVPWYVLGILGIFMAIFGRAPCGWLCPFGFFQDLLSKIKIKKFKFDINKKWYYIRYGVLLVLVILLPFFLRTHWFSQLCPCGTLIAGIPWLMLDKSLPFSWFFVLKLAILVVVIAFAIMVSRSFCRTVCPLGAILGAFNRWSLINLQVDDGCTKCNACKKICPMGIAIYEDTGTPDCIRCMKCTQCPHIHIVVGCSTCPGAKKDNNKTALE